MLNPTPAAGQPPATSPPRAQRPGSGLLPPFLERAHLGGPTVMGLEPWAPTFKALCSSPSSQHPDPASSACSGRQRGKSCASLSLSFPGGVTPGNAPGSALRDLSWLGSGNPMGCLGWLHTSQAPSLLNSLFSPRASVSCFAAWRCWGLEQRGLTDGWCSPLSPGSRFCHLCHPPCTCPIG